MRIKNVAKHVASITRGWFVEEMVTNDKVEIRERRQSGKTAGHLWKGGLNEMSQITQKRR